MLHSFVANLQIRLKLFSLTWRGLVFHSHIWSARDSWRTSWQGCRCGCTGPRSIGTRARRATPRSPSRCPWGSPSPCADHTTRTRTSSAGFFLNSEIRRDLYIKAELKSKARQSGMQKNVILLIIASCCLKWMQSTESKPKFSYFKLAHLILKLLDIKKCILKTVIFT